MIKLFVIDTNTLISAHLIKVSNPRRAYEYVLDWGTLVQSKETLSEFAEKFTHPKFDRYISLQNRIKAINELEIRCMVIPIHEEIIACRDPKDDKFLSLAWNSRADCLISGDKDLLVMHPFRNLPIVNPAQFLKNYKI
ncbi:MAG: putative toxin-antitoxin system toxin component, PIN family [Bacteroidia bacterium]|nr:putative toxin-antitoxin system toxin component, PIN family [Bacteroidia bacterium]MCF8426523.1 putative toxin-antitoxin system toxin component, PIN family [Bacteroidia bacterium]